MTAKKTTGFIIAGLLVSLLLAGVVSSFASGDPDGLDTAILDGCTLDAEGEITGGDCIAQECREHEIGGPFADYAAGFIGDEFAATAVSGVVGVLAAFTVAGGLFWLLRRRRTTPEE